MTTVSQETVTEKTVFPDRGRKISENQRTFDDEEST